MSVDEIVAAEEWLYSTLHADSALMAIATGGIWTTFAPAKTTPPYIILQKQSAMDVSTVGAIRIMDNLRYLVKITGLTTDYKNVLAPAYALMDADLHRKSGTVTGASIFSCTREEPFSLDEIVAGTQYSHLGGSYRLYVQSS